MYVDISHTRKFEFIYDLVVEIPPGIDLPPHRYYKFNEITKEGDLTFLCILCFQRQINDVLRQLGNIECA